MSNRSSSAPAKPSAPPRESTGDSTGARGRRKKPASDFTLPLIGKIGKTSAGDSQRLSSQSVALSEMHHEMLFSISLPGGIIQDANPLSFRKLAADSGSMVGKTLAEALATPELTAFCADLLPGRSVRWTKKTSLGTDTEIRLWEFRALRFTGIADRSALVTVSPGVEPKGTAAGNPLEFLAQLPQAAAEASRSGNPQPLLEWFSQSTAATWTALFYANPETGCHQLAYHIGYPDNSPRVIAHDAALQTLSSLEPSAAGRIGLPCPQGVIAWVCPLPSDEVDGLILVGLAEDENGNAIQIALATFAAAHAPLLDDLLAREHRNAQSTSALRSAPALRSILDEIPQALVFLRRKDARVVEASLSFERMFGYSTAALANMRLDDWLTAPEASVSVRAACETGRIHESDELTLYRRDGEEFPAAVRVIPLPPYEDRDPEVMMIISDLTSSRDARAESRHLQRQAVLGWMAASFAHEIRNPLNNLSLQLEEMHTLHTLEPAVNELALEAQNECRRLTEISRRMLDFARGQDFHPAPTDMTALVQRVLRRMQPVLERNGVQSLFSAPEDLPAAMADPLSIEQVILNLIDNAAKAMPEGGHLGISLELSALEGGAPAVEVRVADTGRGLAPAIKDKLFQPYITTRADGHGLGLALSRHIMDAHRGALRADTYPGSGTVFRVFLPVASENESCPSPS